MFSVILGDTGFHMDQNVDLMFSESKTVSKSDLSGSRVTLF